MALATVLLIAIGLSMDAFAVAVTYGLSFRRREHGFALEIASAFGLFQAAMPLVGWLAGMGLRHWIESFGHWVAFSLLGLIGGKMIVDALRGLGQQRASPEPALDEPDEPRPTVAPAGEQRGDGLDRLRLVGLALATSIDALAVGLALSLLGVSLLVPVLTIGVVTFGISYAGIVLGYELTGRIRRGGRSLVQALGGVILVGIGLRMVLEQLLSKG